MEHLFSQFKARATGNTQFLLELLSLFYLLEQRQQ
jgi:hypothetical protein